MQNAAKLWYFEQFDLIKALSKADKLKIADQVVSQHYKKDDPIMFPFNSQRRIYMLKTGMVKIGNYTDTGEENLKFVLNRGNIFGEMALVDGNSNDFAVAVDHCIICSMPVDALTEFMTINPAFNACIHKLIGTRLRRLETKLANIVFKDSTTRVVEFLKELSNDFGEQKEGAIWVKNFLTNKEIAKLTFTSRQTVSSVLNKLKRNGCITYDEHYIQIIDLQNR